jgi:hypothetical protein
MSPARPSSGRGGMPLECLVEAGRVDGIEVLPAVGFSPCGHRVEWPSAASAWTADSCRPKPWDRPTAIRTPTTLGLSGKTSRDFSGPSTRETRPSRSRSKTEGSSRTTTYWIVPSSPTICVAASPSRPPMTRTRRRVRAQARTEGATSFYS